MGRTSSRPSKDSQPSALASQAGAKQHPPKERSGESPQGPLGSGGAGGEREGEVEDESAGLLGRGGGESSRVGNAAAEGGKEQAEYRHVFRISACRSRLGCVQSTVSD